MKSKLIESMALFGLCYLFVLTINATCTAVGPWTGGLLGAGVEQVCLILGVTALVAIAIK